MFKRGRRKTLGQVIATMCIIICAVVLLTTNDSHGQETSDPSPTVNGYVEALAILEQRAPGEVEAQSPNPDESVGLVALEAGCLGGEVLWQRDSLSAICTSICRSDLECTREGDRCRVFGLAPVPIADATALAEDLDAATLASLDNANTGEVALCDPFWDLNGSLDDTVIDYTVAPVAGAGLLNADGQVDPLEP